MDKYLFMLFRRATYTLGTFHSMLDTTIPDSLIQKITQVNNKQFLQRTKGFNIFFSLYYQEIRSDNKGKKRKEIYEIAKDIWINKFDNIMRNKFESMGKIEEVVVNEARADTMTEILERGSIKVKGEVRKYVKRGNKSKNAKKVDDVNEKTEEKPSE